MPQPDHVTLDLMTGCHAICRLDADAPVPEWAASQTFSSITRTAHELSVICDSAAVPTGVVSQSDFRALRVRGPLDFALVGVVARLCAVLAAASISVFVLSTYDTDYLLVRIADLDAAVGALRSAGHTLVTGA